MESVAVVVILVAMTALLILFQTGGNEGIALTGFSQIVG
jgi:hypothetical protein